MAQYLLPDSQEALRAGLTRIGAAYDEAWESSVAGTSAGLNDADAAVAGDVSDVER